MRLKLEQFKIEFELELNRLIRLRFKRQKSFREGKLDLHKDVQKKKEFPLKFNKAQQIRQKMEELNVMEVLQAEIFKKLLDQTDYGPEFTEWKKLK